MATKTLSHDEVLECVELFGDKVIPEYDTDPVHSTTRYRQYAVPKYPVFNHQVPDIDVTVIPESALLPLVDRPPTGGLS